jgi:hypothetical protein
MDMHVPLQFLFGKSRNIVQRDHRCRFCFSAAMLRLDI